MAVVDALYAGYGEMADVCALRNASANPDRATPCHGPREALLYRRGNAYLTAEFPNMSYIVRAAVRPRPPAWLLPHVALGLGCGLAVLAALFALYGWAHHSPWARDALRRLWHRAHQRDYAETA